LLKVVRLNPYKNISHKSLEDGLYHVFGRFACPTGLGVRTPARKPTDVLKMVIKVSGFPGAPANGAIQIEAIIAT